MKNGNPVLRSFEPITRNDLLRLLTLARQDREEFFRNYPDWASMYAHRILGTALCQGAALHYVRQEVGINDFDVYTFYAVHPERRWYAKRLQSVDYCDSKFGRSEISPKHYIGRRVDLMGRALDVAPGTDLINAITVYLRSGKTETARELASKAVVLLEPVGQLGTIVWPVATWRG